MRKIKRNPSNEEISMKINEIINYIKDIDRRTLDKRISVRDISGFIDPSCD